MAPQIGMFGNFKYEGDEDCLFINVFTPKVTNWNSWVTVLPYSMVTINLQFQ